MTLPLNIETPALPVLPESAGLTPDGTALGPSGTAGAVGNEKKPAGGAGEEPPVTPTAPVHTQTQLQLNPRSRHTAEEIIAAYKQTGSVWAAGKMLGIGGQTVHERLRALGYKLANRKWTRAEIDELRSLIENRVPLGQIAARLGRPYAGVACKANELGFRSNRKYPKKLPRGAGYDKPSTTRHMKTIESYSGKVTQYARANGLEVESLVQALQKHCAERWTAYVSSRSDLPQTTCEYCSSTFIPFSNVQRFCNRKCAQDARQDKSYFGGKRRTTVGLAEGICQLCERHTTRGLSSHHVIGKENDPDNNILVALCQGCHKTVTLLGSRIFVDNETAWESLISLVWMRKHGAEIAAGTAAGDTIFVCVDIDVYDDEEEEQ